eukprot:CAMPEP_0172669788 /NCGR_PEP_ID=MMETSP1074-20121228/9898_1 /TAXON_ID=2916 /ORGANISM="Ceratium fusus, Strain PA161109" /LENGTH=231 /DNA_ID=CAMNT_0013486609 /DNA_START=47 /DNA_END=743 /DNA_ORIENTATION=-
MAGSSDKIFVGGLPRNCSDDAFSSYFEQFGNITDVVVMKDRDTGESRGFGFVTYDSPETVDRVIERAAQHKIHDKWVDVKRATPKGSTPPPGSSKGGGRSRAYDDDDDEDGPEGGGVGKDYSSGYGGYNYGGSMGPYGCYGGYGAYCGYGGYGPYGGYMGPSYPGYPPYYGAYGPYKGYPPGPSSAPSSAPSSSGGEELSKGARIEAAVRRHRMPTFFLAAPLQMAWWQQA